MAAQVLLAVGYWFSHPRYRLPDNDRFPDPISLVAPSWRPDERLLIPGYLRSGWPYACWRGLSYCRLDCGADFREMGSRCLTDGEWVWPEGLAHYVEAHDIRLPEEFVESMRRRGWQVPEDDPRATRDAGATVDYSFWIAWGRAAIPDASAEPGEAHRPRD